eukprot:TRINITY_DN67067_c2_g3_i1.p1 TRINITY_DN67067_c2_g3~~TRINITY_DN67067_c2_g3_i1.p1  ORF type:complete len:225 (+),score=34.25 TRINITY_DN67067_c2_g3_i1:38-712(+)
MSDLGEWTEAYLWMVQEEEDEEEFGTTCGEDLPNETIFLAARRARQMVQASSELNDAHDEGPGDIFYYHTTGLVNPMANLKNRIGTVCRAMPGVRVVSHHVGNNGRVPGTDRIVMIGGRLVARTGGAECNLHEFTVAHAGLTDPVAVQARAALNANHANLVRVERTFTRTDLLMDFACWAVNNPGANVSAYRYYDAVTEAANGAEVVCSDVSATYNVGNAAGVW